MGRSMSKRRTSRRPLEGEPARPQAETEGVAYWDDTPLVTRAARATHPSRGGQENDRVRWGEALLSLKGRKTRFSHISTVCCVRRFAVSERIGRRER